MYEMLGPLILFSLAVSLTPGPNVIMVTATAANFGFVRTVPQIFGITLGFGSLVLAMAVGLAGLFEAEPRLHTLLKYAGGIYLIYLAWCIARADAASAGPGRSSPIGPIQAALLQWVNPKAWILTVGALAAFTTTDGHLVREIPLVGGIITASVLLSVVIWAGFGAVLARIIGNPGVRTAFNWSMALLLVASLVPVFW